MFAVSLSPPVHVSIARNLEVLTLEENVQKTHSQYLPFFFPHRKLFDLQCFSTLASTCSSFVVDCCFLLGLDSSRAEDVDQFCSKLMHLSSSIRLNDYLNWRKKKLSKWESLTSFL